MILGIILIVIGVELLVFFGSVCIPTVTLADWKYTSKLDKIIKYLKEGGKWFLIINLWVLFFSFAITLIVIGSQLTMKR